MRTHRPIHLRNGANRPRRYDESKVLTDVVAQRTAMSRLDLEVQTSERGPWRSVGRPVGGGDLGDLGSGFVDGGEKLNTDTYVRNTDKHYDAMLFPHIHPYGTGSLNCEVGTVTLNKYVKSRAMSLESFFRRSSTWAFFSLDRLIKQRLFFANWAKRRQGMRVSALNSGDDKFTKTFGQVVPASIPESTAWWQRRAKELSAMTCDQEMGLFQIMVTVTHNNRCGEMLAVLRRGPFASPTDQERLEYLLTRVKKGVNIRKGMELHSVEHRPFYGA